MSPPACSPSWGSSFCGGVLIETPLGTLANPGPGAAPLLLAVLIAFAIWTAAARTPLGAETAEGDEPARWGLAHAACIFAAIAFAASAIGYLGYRLTVLAVLFFLIGVVERKPIAPALSVSLPFPSAPTGCSFAS